MLLRFSFERSAADKLQETTVKQTKHAGTCMESGSGFYLNQGAKLSESRNPKEQENKSFGAPELTE